MNKENIKKTIPQLENMGCGFFFAWIFIYKVWRSRSKSFLDELAPYLLSVGIALGIWSDHDVNSEGDDK